MELSDREKELIEMFRKLDERGKNDCINFAAVTLSVLKRFQDGLTADQLEIVK